MGKRNWKKWLAVLLCMAMCMGNAGVSRVYAAVTDGETGEELEETPEQEEPAEEEEEPEEEEKGQGTPGEGKPGTTGEEKPGTPEEEKPEIPKDDEGEKPGMPGEGELEKPGEESGETSEEDKLEDLEKEESEEFEVDDSDHTDILSNESMMLLTNSGSGDDYPDKYKNAQPDTIVDEWNFYNRECTSFVAWRLNSRNSISFTNWYRGVKWGNASNWAGAARSLGITVDMNPAVGAVAWWGTGTYGHVAWVSSVEGNNVTIEEYNSYKHPYVYNQRTISKTEVESYIHIKDITAQPEPTGTEMDEEDVSRTLRDGDYHIVSALDSNWGLHVEGISYEAGANVHLWEGVTYDYQVFTLTCHDSGFYSITRGGKAMEVAGGSQKRGDEANVRMWYSNGSYAQQWAIKEAGGGTYTLQMRKSGFYMDVKDSKVDYGSNIWMWDTGEAPAQKWRFIPCGNAIGQTIPDGEYQIAMSRDTSKTLGAENNQMTAGTNVHLNSYGADRRNTFDVKYLGDGEDGHGQYNITSHVSGLSLDLNGGKWTKGTNVGLFTPNGTVAQQWMIKENPNGGYNIISRCNGMYLDVDSGVLADGRNIQIWEGNDTIAQSWVFLPWNTDPGITMQPTASEITYGQTLSDSMISGGTTVAAGSFAWKDGMICPTCADSGKTGYTVVFTPYDTDGWESVELEITVKVNPAQNAPGMPGAEMNAAFDKQTVGDISLPAGWAWQESDRGVTLDTGAAVTATAVYTGSDKGNYVKESVNVSITKSSCDHPKEKQERRGVVDADCENGGNTGNIYCTKCNTVIESGHTTEKLGHHYEEEITKEPTEDAEGEKTYTCSRCNDTYTEPIPKLPKEEESHSHSYNSSITLEPACAAVGERTYICSCGKSYIEMIPALGHDYDVEITKEPTEDAEGVKTYICRRCNYSYTDNIPKKGENHEHSYSSSVTLEPACETAGERTYICSCGRSYIEMIPALGHDYEAVVTKRPTKDEEGEKVYTCRRCKHSYTETIPKGGEGDKEGSHTGSTWMRGQSVTSDRGTGEMVMDIKTWKPQTPDEKKRYACMGTEPVQYTLAKDNAYRIVIENAMQGPLCFASFESALDGYTIGRTYNIYTLPNNVYSREQEVQFTLTIPEAVYKEGRNYKMICVTKNGVPVIYDDLDDEPRTITVRTNKFYAYALIYK